MNRELIIKVTSDDDTDLDFIQSRAVGVVEDVVDDYSGHFDGTVQVEWEWRDG